MASSSDCAARSATGWPSSGARTRPSACRRCRPRTSASSRAIIAQVLESHARSEITAGRMPPNAEQEEELAASIHAALFGVGRIQPLLEDQQLENIDINGCDRVFLGYADGREVVAEPVAETDDELVELIQ